MSALLREGFDLLRDELCTTMRGTSRAAALQLSQAASRVRRASRVQCAHTTASNRGVCSADAQQMTGTPPRTFKSPVRLLQVVIDNHPVEKPRLVLLLVLLLRVCEAERDLRRLREKRGRHALSVAHRRGGGGKRALIKQGSAAARQQEMPRSVALRAGATAARAGRAAPRAGSVCFCSPRLLLRLRPSASEPLLQLLKRGRRDEHIHRVELRALAALRPLRRAGSQRSGV